MLKFSGLLLLVAVSLTACVNGRGDVVSQTFEVSGFTKIDHGIKGDVILVNDVTQYVEVQAQQNIIDILKIDVDGGTLNIRTKSAKSIGKYDELKFYVHAPVIESIKIGGKGTVTGNAITSDNFSCRLTAEGRLELTGVDASKVEITATGAGTVIMKGHSDKTTIGVGSVGRIQCFELPSDNVEVQLKGNGTIETTANSTLDVLLSGNGTIYYKGSPTVTQKITGNGILVHTN